MKIFKTSSFGQDIDGQSVEANFADLHPRLDNSNAIIEAAKCLYCYEAPCQTACPTAIDIPKFIKQIQTEKPEDAAITILSENIMGGTCARACPTEELCEQVCVVHHTYGAPVKIGELQRYAVDALMAKDEKHPFEREAKTGKTFAVIGAGPAGLSFAHRAAMFGHDVKIFEAKSKPGGLNEYGLAEYKMADDFARRETEFLLAIGGIEIAYDQALGDELTLEKLQSEFDGVFIGVGLGDNRSLDIAGADLKGIQNATDFIAQLRQAEIKSAVNVGDNVVVIGGGNTAIDAAVQARCLGSKNVTLVYRRGHEDMSATGWECELATANGVRIIPWAAPHSFEGDEHSRVKIAHFARTKLVDGKLEVTKEQIAIPADMVLKAIGQLYECPALSALEMRGNKISVNDSYETSLSGIYAGGDCVATGEDLTVQAVEDGKQAAIAAHRWVMG